MNEPKPPSLDADWRNVDIYLFSNGQHHTPPRKYHLGAEDLTSWSSTLVNLAHAQYGSTIFSPIDLYTVDGQKLSNPLQISNGITYVAVPLRDTFIPAGYSEYLMKASRSREKRQSKQSAKSAQLELQVMQQGDIDGKLQAIELQDIEAKTEMEEVEIVNEESGAASTSIGDQTNAIPKLQPQTIKRNNSLRPNNQNSTILRKHNSQIGDPIRKTSMKVKDNPLRKNLKVNTIKGTNHGSTIITNNNDQSKANSRPVTKTGKTDRESILRIVSDRPKIEKKMEAQISEIKLVSSVEKTVGTENNIMENIIDDNELIIVKKQESDMRSMMFTDLEKSGNVLTTKQTRLSSVIPILMPISESASSGVIKEETPVTIINNLIENVYKPDADVPNDVTSSSRSKLQVGIPEPEVEKIKVSIKPPVNKNIVPVVDKGDIVNLNLRIELVRKGECLQKFTEKSSQDNIQQEIIKTITKQSSITSKLKVGEDNPKIVVIQCSCCENHNLNDILTKMNTSTIKVDDDKKYVMIMPEPGDPKVERTQVSREESRGLEKCISVTKTSTLHPVKKVYATTSIQRLTTVKSTQDIDGTVSTLDSRGDNCQSRHEVVEIVPTLSNFKKLYQADSFLSAQHKFSTQRSLDDSTQTEYCTMLLEARRHDDGHYSFYLPPLHVLKMYGL